MARQYSDSIPPGRKPFPALVIDSGSPVVSVALDLGRGAPSERTLRLGQSSGALLRLIGELLMESGLGARDLRSLVGLRGPGSFTGLRVGLSTLLGLHEALGIAATGFSTLQALAMAAEGTRAADGIVLATVDALRDEWFLQPFRLDPARAPRALSEPHRADAAGLLEEVVSKPAETRGPGVLCGFGAAALAERAGLPAGWSVLEPDSLAGAACGLLRREPPEWNANLLCEPLYLRPPAVSRPSTG